MSRPKKSLGQNFLVDPNLQQKIVDTLAPHADDEVLEIGPGTGALTRRIVGRVRRLVAVELDDVLAADLEAELGGRDDVDILHRDILDVETAEVTSDPERLKVIGNIPYNITTPLIFRLLERQRRPAVLVLMVQREVADRILASPGSKAYGALSVGVRAVASAERLLDVRRTAFRPVPDVDSTVLRITPIRPPPLEQAEEDALRTLTRVAFSRRRKQLQRILRSAPEYGLDAADIESLCRETGLDLEARPEDLAPTDFIALTRALRTKNTPAPSTAVHSAATSDLQLLGVVAHELRSPLTAIMGYQELLDEGFYGSLEASAVEPIRRIGNCARQLLTLINGMEQLVQDRHTTASESQVERAEAEADRSNEAASSLEDCLAEIRREAATRHIALEIRPPETPGPVHELPAHACDAVELVLHAALKLATADALTFTVEQDHRGTTITASGQGLDRCPMPAEPAAGSDPNIAIDSGAALRLVIARRIVSSLGGRLFSHTTAYAASLVLEIPAARDGPSGPWPK